MKMWIYGAMIAGLAAIGAFCGYQYVTEVKLPEIRLDEAADSQDALFEEIRQSFSIPRETHVYSTDTEPDTAVSAEPQSAAVAWLTIPGTHIDYPVAQAKDNEFYLYRGIDGELNQRLGCPFLDYRCRPDFSGFNSIIYAHHMTKQRMFADIVLFKDSSFMERCPEGTLTTTGGQYSVRFFAYLTIPSDSPVYQTEFAEEQDRAAYLSFLFANASYTRTYSLDELKEKEELHLLLLSTCSYEYQEARGVLAGVIE